jgi:hypothetical protein
MGEGDFQRTLECMQDLIFGQRLNTLFIAFVCEWCVVGMPVWARAVLERDLETA